MNTYIEVFKSGKIIRRYSVSQISDKGRNFLKSSLKIDGFTTKTIESISELETGSL